MVVEPVTTWLLVRISPVELMIMPVPAAALVPTVVLTSTIAGSTRAAIASRLERPAEGAVVGETAAMGASGELDAEFRTVPGLITLARLHPTPAPAAAAT